MPEDLFYEFAMPNHPGLREFDCGNEKVNDYFKKCTWFNETKGKSSPSTYVFRTEKGGEVVGYIAMSFKKIAHPCDTSESRARYLIIYMIGVNKKFIGKNNARNQDVSYAKSILEIAEGHAIQDPNCVGVSLWVRSDNQRAINFYKKMGLSEDLGGPIPRDDKGAPFITMRKLISI